MRILSGNPGPSVGVAASLLDLADLIEELEAVLRVKVDVVSDGPDGIEELGAVAV